MEGVYSGALADAISNYVKKRQLAGMRANPSDISAMTAGATSTWGANNRADQTLELAKKNAADQLKLQQDTLAFNKENAANQLATTRELEANKLATTRELADKNTGLQTWLYGNMLNASQKAQPTGLDKALSYGGSALTALALNNMANNPLGKVGNLAYSGLEKLSDASGLGNFLFNLFGGGDSIFNV